jgi:carboxyl-terminal processing protease
MNKRKITTILWVFIAILGLSTFASCRKSIKSTPTPDQYPGDNYPDLFQAFWNGMNTNYVFWGIDTTNWDRMYTKYKPLFDQLTYFDQATETKAEQYFSEMCQGIIDSHFTLTFELTGNTFQPATYRRQQINPNYFTDSTFPSAVLDSLVPKKYIDAGTLVKGIDTITIEGTQTPMEAVSGTVNKNILYLYFNVFALSQAGANTTPVFNYFFNVLHHLPPSIKGIVMDLRGNGGGEVADLDFIMGQMTNAQYTVGSTSGKNGPGRLDYTPWAPAVVNPYTGGGVNITIPVVALGDHLTVSMAELTTMAIKSLPNKNGIFIGTQTWGANGPLTSPVYYNGGQFTIGTSAWGYTGYMNVYTSSTMFKYKDGKIYEGVGIPPDIYARETNAAYLGGKDLVLDAAITYINAH